MRIAPVLDRIGCAGGLRCCQRCRCPAAERRAQARDLLTELGADAYITLASSGPAPRGLKESGSRTFLTPGSWLGFPAFALPLLHSAGIPFGIQLLGADHRDGNLFAAARWIMREFN